MSLIALHSSSCAFYNNELFVTFYAGKKECVDQRVFVFIKNKNKFSLFREMPLGSGNPVLMIFNNKLYCCYSMFSRPMTDNVLNMWENTYICVEDLTSDKRPKYVLSTYCCPRNNPYYFLNNSLLLPCYDEGIKRGVFFRFIPGESMERYVCMNEFPVIQPTIVRKDNKIFSFFRNFKKSISLSPSECYAPYCSMDYSVAQKTVIFGETKKSLIPNHNESLATINDSDDNPIVIYNNSENRQELTLGILNDDKIGNILSENRLKINEQKRASYPNCCFNNKNQLVVSYTSYEGNSINQGSSICISYISTKYDSVLSRQYICSSDLEK